jgi:hypothetical protein
MIQQVLDDQTESQLKVLSEISAISSSLGCNFWLRGGWAIDFLLGWITRSHEDIDLITWILHREQLEKALTEVGYERMPVKEYWANRTLPQQDQEQPTDRLLFN